MPDASPPTGSSDTVLPCQPTMSTRPVQQADILPVRHPAPRRVLALEKSGDREEVVDAPSPAACDGHLVTAPLREHAKADLRVRFVLVRGVLQDPFRREPLEEASIGQGIHVAHHQVRRSCPGAARAASPASAATTRDTSSLCSPSIPVSGPAPPMHRRPFMGRTPSPPARAYNTRFGPLAQPIDSPQASFGFFRGSERAPWAPPRRAPPGRSTRTGMSVEVGSRRIR